MCKTLKYVAKSALSHAKSIRQSFFEYLYKQNVKGGVELYGDLLYALLGVPNFQNNIVLKLYQNKQKLN